MPPKESRQITDLGGSLTGSRLALTLLIAGLCIAGSLSLGLSLYGLPVRVGPFEWLVALLAICLELLRVDLLTYRGSEGSSVSLGQAASFLVLAFGGVELAVVVVMLQGLLAALTHQNVWYKALFNLGQATTITLLAGKVYIWSVAATSDWDQSLVVASGLTAIVFFAMQSLCLTLAISLSTGFPFRKIWSDSFRCTVLQQVVIGMIGFLLGRSLSSSTTLLGVALMGSPLFMLSYSYKAFARRTEAHVRTIEQVNLDLARLNDELHQTNQELVQALSSVLDARDRYTYGHSHQVATYSVALGEKLNLPPEELERLRLAALLHDIGKVGIPESILLKPSRLEDAERLIMQAHAEIGYRITSQIRSLIHVADIIRQHHEWFGGGGYPRNLKGEQISLHARIIGVADALDTIISDRPYRRGRAVETALWELQRCAGTQFDPLVVEAVLYLAEERGLAWFANSAVLGHQGALADEVAASMASQ